MSETLLEKIAEFKRLDAIVPGSNQYDDEAWGDLCYELTPLLIEENDTQVARIAELEAGKHLLEDSLHEVCEENAALEAELAARWVACDERMPEDDEIYLIRTYHHFLGEEMAVMYYMGDNKWSDGEYGARPTHWMRLPASPVPAEGGAL